LVDKCTVGGVYTPAHDCGGGLCSDDSAKHIKNKQFYKPEEASESTTAHLNKVELAFLNLRQTEKVSSKMS